MAEQDQGYHEPQDPRQSDVDRHLEGMLVFERRRKPWVTSFFEEIRDFIAPKKLPPLRVTSKPVQPKEVRAGIFVYSGALEEETGPTRLSSRFQPGVAMDSDHLQRLAHTGEEVPALQAFFYNIRDYFFPRKQPPLQVTSKPVQVKSIWGFSGGKGRYAGLFSGLAHASVIAFLFIAASQVAQDEELKDTVTLIAPDIDIAPYVPKMQPKPQQMGGGGGGGSRDPLPASKGKLPPVAPRQFVPPAAVVYNDSPRLVMQPTIVVQPEAQLPDVDIMAWGDPLGVAGPPSNGPGSGGGIGSGSGGGVGPGKGVGYGPGEGGGMGGGVYRIGGGVSAPTLIYKVEPEYSEEARKAKYQGTVVLYVVVNEKGLPMDLKIVRALGLGLDEKAIEAVQKWRFRPGYLNGKPVKVAATIEVNFRLL
jgi:TonB family protein